MTRFRTVFFDCDSTLVAIEGIDALGREHQAAVAELTARAMAGELPLEEVYSRRLDITRPDRATLEDLGAAYVAGLVPGTAETVGALQAAGVDVRIISGGLRVAVLAVAAALGVPAEHTYAVDIALDAAGGYHGFDEAQLLARSGGKRTLIEALPAFARPALLVGDGATDLEARPAVDAFCAYTGVSRRARIAEAAGFEAADMAAVRAIVLGVSP